MALLLVILGKAQDKAAELFRKNGIQTQGIVVENKLCWGRNVVVRAVVQYTTTQGELIEALDENGSAFAMPKFRVGQKIALVYEKSNPRNFRIMNGSTFA